MFTIDTLPAQADVVVVGGGIFGAASAWNLANAGLKVVVLDRGDFCGEASGANFGMMNPSYREHGLLFELGRRTGQIYADFTNIVGREIHYDRSGIIRPAMTPEDVENIREWTMMQHTFGIEADFLDAAELLQLEPMLPEGVLGGSYVHDGGYIYPFSIVAGYLSKAKELGATLASSTAVTGIRIADGRVAAVETTRGTINTNIVVNAAGAWASEISAMAGVYTPVVPVRGQILVTEPVKGLPTHLISGLFPSLGYTWAGNGLIGSIQEDAGFDKHVTQQVIGKFARAVVEHYPKLQHVQIIRAWAGLRPKTPDELPILGAAEEVEGFVVATGGFHLGMILGGAVGEVIRDILLGVPPSIDITTARPDRFTPARAS